MVPIQNALTSALSAGDNNLGGLKQTTAQAVSAQNQAATLSSAETIKGKPKTGWRIPELKNFKLDPAMEKANTTAVNHLQNLLSPDGMYVEMQQEAEESAPEATSYNSQNRQAVVRETGSEKELKSYSGQAVLQLYAHNQHRSSIIVDGKV